MSHSQLSTFHTNPLTAWIEPFTLLCQRGAVAALTLAIVLALVGVRSAQCQSYGVIYTFNGGPDGAMPEAGLSQDPRNGNLFGTTFAGGKGYGGVFQLVPRGAGWALSPLYNFTGLPDGEGTRSRIAVAPDGTLYGATIAGGADNCGSFYSYKGCGTVFSLKPPVTVACKTLVCFWKETQLHVFTGNDGAKPYADLTLDSGNIYGGTYLGGRGYGVIYELTGGSWAQSILYTFGGGTDGAFPQGGVIFGKDRNLYGTALAGGDVGYGVVFQLSPGDPEWTENTLHSFEPATDGGAPVAGVVFDSLGDIYGATIQYGPATGGTAFKLESGSWTFDVLHSFSYPGFGGDDCGPSASLIKDNDGNLYGTTFCDGANQKGSVFKLSPDGHGGFTETDLYNFTGGADGAHPFGGVVLDSQGNLYGTASQGGNLNCNPPNGCGVVWKIAP